MKRIILLVTIFLAVPLIFFATSTKAQTFRSGENIQISGDENIDSTLWISGSNVDVAGSVNGDVFCAGRNVTISGSIDGDIICAAQNVRIYGTVTGDIRIAAQTAIINGIVEQNLSGAVETLELEEDSEILGDVVIAGESVRVNGTAGRDAAFMANVVTISGDIGRTISGRITELSLTENANVDGDITYTSANETSIADGAEITGSVSRLTPDSTTGIDMGRLKLFVFFYGAVSFLFFALILVLLFPSALRRLTDSDIAQPLKATLIGLAANILIPALFVTLLMSAVGMPLAFALITAWVLVLILSAPVVAYLLGRLIVGKGGNAIGAMALGALILLVGYFIPILNILVFLVVMWLGSGMIVLYIYKRTPRPKYT